MNQPIDSQNAVGEESTVAAQISTTIAAQLEEFDNVVNAIVAEVSDTYVLNILAARRYEFLLNLTTTIERKLNEQQNLFLRDTVVVVTRVINALNEKLAENTIAIEQATAKRFTAAPTPTLQLSSYRDVLEQKRNQQSNLLSLKVPENPTTSDVDAIEMLGISLADIKNSRKKLDGSSK